MADRQELQELLVTLLGSPHVYFQPPESIRMQYPCIVYNRQNMDNVYADDSLYKHMTRYQVVVMDPDPDSVVTAKVKELPYCSYERFYAVDDLNHDVFNLFF